MHVGDHVASVAAFGSQAFVRRDENDRWHVVGHMLTVFQMAQVPMEIVRPCTDYNNAVVKRLVGVLVHFRLP
ncbi:hypothetical protein D3C75_1371890 [compost metagenome]